MNELFLQSGPIAVRPLLPEDAPLLLTWLTNPRVLEWYEGCSAVFTPERVREDFYENSDDEPDMRRCIVEYENAPIGYVQVYPVEGEGLEEYGYPPTEETVFAMDQFIGEPEFWGRRIGRRFVSLILEHLADREGAQAVLLDPHADNPRAIRCYEACGFRKVKLLPEHELHDGKLTDCWLMEYRPEQKKE